MSKFTQLKGKTYLIFKPNIFLNNTLQQKLDGPSHGRPQPRVTGERRRWVKKCGFGQYQILGPFNLGIHGHTLWNIMRSGGQKL